MEKDYTKYRGDDITFGFTFKDANNAVIDITGWTVFFTLKSSLSDLDAAAVIKKDVTSHTDPVNGETQIDITSSEINDLLGDYYYDMQYKNAAGKIVTIQHGTMTFIEDVTRRTT